jgi:hypothetical protein
VTVSSLRRKARWLNRLAPQRGQLRSALMTPLTARPGAESALSMSGLAMHAVALAAVTRLSRSVAPTALAGPDSIRPRRQAAAHGTRHVCPQSRQTRSYSAEIHGMRTKPY